VGTTCGRGQLVVWRGGVMMIAWGAATHGEQRRRAMMWPLAEWAVTRRENGPGELASGPRGEEKEGVGCWAAQRKRERGWRAGPAGEYGPSGFWENCKVSISYFDSNSNSIRILTIPVAP
jgi:hypothetical protein